MEESALGWSWLIGNYPVDLKPGRLSVDFYGISDVRIGSATRGYARLEGYVVPVIEVDVE